MRIIIPAIQLNQNKGIETYLTKLSINQIRDLIKNKQLIVDTYKPDISAEGGYQRSLDEKRIKKIKTFLESKYKMVLPIIPTSIVLSIRKNSISPLTFEDGKLIIGDDATLYVVDGQHRVWGVKDHKIDNYEVPVTIINGLNQHQEAAQFLVINSSQKKVDPSLQLRVLYYSEQKLMENLIDEIKNVIPWKAWKLEALRIAIALENDPENPWYKKVKVPNEKTTEGKPIKEGSFVDTFRYMCGEDNPISSMGIDYKIAQLKDYWNTIRKLWSKAFQDDYVHDYVIVAPFGAGVFNTLFPSALTLKEVMYYSFEKILQPVAESYPLIYWKKRKGKLANRGTSQLVYRQTAVEFLITINENFDYIDQEEYERLRDKTYNKRWLVDKAYEMLSPLLLRSAKYIKDGKVRYKRACYVLVNLSDSGKLSIYVGQSKSVENRLASHKKTYNLFYARACETQDEMNQLEGTLWHLVKRNVRENDKHPNAKFCSFCE